MKSKGNVLLGMAFGVKAVMKKGIIVAGDCCVGLSRNERRGRIWVA